jgi:uncharacterized membrane protein YfcA
MEMNHQKRSARTMSTVIFVFMSSVSALIYFTEENLDLFGLVLILIAPFALAAIFYFAVLTNDPEQSD